VTSAHPAHPSGIADLAEAADKLQHAQDGNLQRLGDAIRSYLDGNGSLDECVQLEFDIRDNNERREVRRDKRDHALATAAALLPPGSHRDHARKLLAYAAGVAPPSPLPLATAIELLRQEPLSLNRLDDIFKRNVLPSVR
jgi:hypothetical protein